MPRIFSPFALARVLLLGSTLVCLGATGPLESTQEALKRGQYYFGPITGALDDETRSALRRYQIHAGLPVSGEPDGATLEALQKEGSDDAAAANSGGERSVRDRARSIVRGDQEFLESLEQGEPEPSEAPNSEKNESPQTAPEKSESAITALPQDAPAVTDAEQTSRPESRPVKESRQSQTTNSFNTEDATRFVEEYLLAAEGPAPDEELSFYADRVDYFQSGKVEKSFIAKDQRNYYRRWRKRSFELQEQPVVLRAGNGSATVRFRMRYALAGDGENAKGETENIIRINLGGSVPKIASIRERKVSSE